MRAGLRAHPFAQAAMSGSVPNARVATARRHSVWSVMAENRAQALLCLGAMSFSVAVWGRLELPAKSFAAWRRARVDAARYDDWTGDFAAPFPHKPTTVTKHLAHHKQDDALTYRVKDATWSVRGVLDEDTYRDECAEIASTFRAAAEHEGRGELVFFGMGMEIVRRRGRRRQVLIS